MLAGCCGCSDEFSAGGDAGFTMDLFVAAVAGCVMVDEPSWASWWNTSARHASEESGVEAFKLERIVSGLSRVVGLSDGMELTSSSDPSEGLSGEVPLRELLVALEPPWTGLSE